MYKIDPDGRGAFDVLCDQETDGGGWTVFQKRQDGTVGFYRGWDAYKRGFGYLKGEFWIGLDKIHRLTTNDNNKLRIDLKLHSEVAYAAYSFFAVQNEADNYKLIVGDYSGNAIFPSLTSMYQPTIHKHEDKVKHFAYLEAIWISFEGFFSRDV